MQRLLVFLFVVQLVTNEATPSLSNYNDTSSCQTKCLNSSTTNIDCSYQNLTSPCLQTLLSSLNTSDIISLNLCGNNLNEFVPLISSNKSQTFSNLLYLNLSNNVYVEIPGDLQEITPKLLELDLSGNNIENISAANFRNRFGQQIGIPSLFSLVLSRNRLKQFSGKPFEIGFTNLRRLYLDHNEMTYFDNNQLQGLTNLIVLDLRANLLEMVPYGGFTFSKILSYVYMDANNIKQVYSLSFVNLQTLHYLSLANNSISVFYNMAFSRSLMYTLDLRYNKLESISNSAFENTEITEMLLTGNPIRCTCDMKAWLNKCRSTVFGDCHFVTDLGRRNQSAIGNYISEVCDPCRKMRCKENEVCKVNQSDKPFCSCQSPPCSTSPCIDHQCYTGSTCREVNKTDYECICSVGYNGKFCNITSEINNNFTTTSTVLKKASARKNEIAKVGLVTISIGCSLVGVVLFSYGLKIFKEMLKTKKSKKQMSYRDLDISTVES